MFSGGVAGPEAEDDGFAECSAAARPGLLARAVFRTAERIGEASRGAAGPERFRLARVRRPAGQEDDLEAGADAAVGLARRVGGVGTREHATARQRARALGDRVGLAHAAQVAP